MKNGRKSTLLNNSDDKNPTNIQSFHICIDNLIKSMSTTRIIQANSVQDILKMLRTCKVLGDQVIKMSMRMSVTSSRKSKEFWKTFEQAYSTFINETKKQGNRLKASSSKTFKELKTSLNKTLISRENSPLKGKTKNAKSAELSVDLKAELMQFISNIDEIESDVDCFYDYSLSNFENNVDNNESEFQKIISALKYTEDIVTDFYRKNGTFQNQQNISEISLYIINVKQIFIDFKDLRVGQFANGQLFYDARSEIGNYIARDIDTINDISIVQLEASENKPKLSLLMKPTMKPSRSRSNSNRDILLLKTKLNESRRNIKKLNEEVAKLNQMKDAENETLAKRKKQMTQKMRECNVAQSEFDSISLEIEELETEKAEIENQIKEIESRNKRKRENRQTYKKEYEYFLNENDALKSRISEKIEDVSKNLEEFEELKNEFEMNLSRASEDESISEILQEYIDNVENRKKLYSLLKEVYQKENEYNSHSYVRNRMMRFTPNKKKQTSKKYEEIRNEYRELVSECESTINQKYDLIAERFSLKQKYTVDNKKTMADLVTVRKGYEEVKKKVIPRCGKTSLDEWENIQNKFLMRLNRIRSSAIENLESNQNKEDTGKVNEEEVNEEMKLYESEIDRMKKRYYALFDWTDQLDKTNLKEEAHSMTLALVLDIIQEKKKDKSFDENEFLDQKIHQLQFEVKQVAQKLTATNDIYKKIYSILREK